LPENYHHRYFRWVNTNYLLNTSGYNGLKTGITEAAGPCLAASYEKGSDHYIVILLCSKSMDSRWEEVPQLIDWAQHRQ